MARDYSTMSATALGEARAVALRNIAEHDAEARRLQDAAGAERAQPWPFGGDEAAAAEYDRQAAEERRISASWRADLVAIDTRLAVLGAAAQKTASTAQTNTSADLTARSNARNQAAAEEADDTLGGLTGYLLSAVGLAPGQSAGERAAKVARLALWTAILGGGGLLAAKAGGAIWRASSANFERGAKVLPAISGLAL